MAVDTENTPELTRDQVATMLTEPLTRFSTFLAAGPSFYDTDGSKVRVPKGFTQTTDEIIANNWHGENEQINEVSPEAGELELLPDTMKSIKTITRFSNELARQSIVSLEQALQNRLVTDVADAFDAQFLSDQGDGVTIPQGMFAWPDVETIDATEFDLDTIMDGYGVFLGNFGHTDGLRLFIRSDDYMALRKLKDNDNRYLLQPDMSTGGIVVPALGATLAVSNRIPEGNAALVDMRSVAVARDLAPSVKLLTERYADYDQQAIRVVARYDAGLTDNRAMVKFNITAQA
jgi:HK97 family phage major capsid protein